MPCFLARVSATAFSFRRFYNTYTQMLGVSLSPSKIANVNQTLISLLDKCKSVLELKQLHAIVVSKGLSQDESYVSKIIFFSALSNSGDIGYSYRVFSQLCSPSILCWNTIIRGYSNSKNPNGSFSVFLKMLRLGFAPDYLTYPFLIKASARLLNLEAGVSVHSHIIKTGHESDRFIQNSLIHMYASCGNIMLAHKVFDCMESKNLVSWNSMLDGYAKCGEMILARKVFDSMSEKDVRSWSSLIDGYVKAGEYREALAVFEKMRAVGPKANEVTMVSVLCACAHLGALEKGRIMHNYVVDNGLPMTLVLRTSLVDMYAKCGAIDEAFLVFHGVSKNKTDVLIWNAMIGGLATHGFVQESLKLFKDMQVVGVLPDEITYLCLLAACAHGGLVKEAWYFFESLSKCGMTPTSEHCACMVDVLARAGQLAAAYQFICQMPMQPTASVLGALLSGCINHRDFDLAEIVGRKLIELEPYHDGRYIGLSNAYAVEKRWDDARSMREAMERRGVKKSPGFSSVEISGVIHSFIAHDKTHPNSEETYSMLNFVVYQMKLGCCQDQEIVLNGP
ncbi:pentatricopeptide repeat-containing protein At5g08305 isoform X1 [Arachis duranensis]|uniref:Pentatricopeptide repeat-containing protein n=3 Tax=Arachis TaxID=3817 RepID=A0A445BE25_ARAHY|nr:pentatricopeptide repeat-containing protein At5g08305 isoform X1 [Arachis duranensis]XP_025620845.1 pentatricopeptide repeat-containing protein At5g08305 isoform X1 [Arachis hypogaea]XP_025620849.1 pentatricopeptide repeat-containing protein At5g08305 isoform X1 [Arachis hypogaea]XP_025620850.1 pentatricopeptide repeat-containing protein At5g08305 isoform X1 [Arachis hypogaea]XP_029145083.1 pentatricopeptide repeat-containing protein At5g08305 isoform X1 [Arachis hypogaea]XP_029145084.1 pen